LPVNLLPHISTYLKIRFYHWFAPDRHSREQTVSQLHITTELIEPLILGSPFVLYFWNLFPLFYRNQASFI